ncbi:MAG: 50S ribosomal protein L29 [Candidatus Cloacimonadota bacterium]|nr:MAG: 50S ribosomal protein L29 [Candidatus Cloacimonadota bacterium]
MKTSEIKKLSSEEMAVKLEAARKELFNLKMRKAIGQLDKTSRIQSVKKSIAKILTIQKELA